MAHNRKDCLEEILEALGGRVRREDIDAHLDDIDARADEYVADGMARADALRRATEEKLKEESIKNAILKRNAREDAIKDRSRMQFYQEAMKRGHGAEVAIEARLTGINTPIFDPKSRTGHQQSAAALALGAAKDWIGGVVTDLERLGRDDPKMIGLDRVLYSRAIEDDIFREKWQLDSGPKGKPGITKNEQALAIAKVLHKWDKVRVNALNSEGAWITDYAGYMMRITHDPDRIRKASNQSPFSFRKGFEQADREYWADFTLRRLDVRRTFGGHDAPDKALAEMYGGFVTGDHLEPETISGDPMFKSVARQVSQQRTLHFKDADSALEYLREFGRYTPTEAWLNSMKSSANHYALMKVFGSKPKEGFENDLAFAKNQTMGTPERAAIDKRERALRVRFDVVSGEADRPIASQWAGVVNGVMAVQRVAKLGFTPFAMIQDNVNISRELARHGLSWLERNATILNGYFQGSEGSAKAEVADLLHTGILGRLRGVTARFDISDARSGSMAAMENMFFKLTGISAMTENKRADAERMMAFALGKKRDKAFADLGQMETHLLQGYGIGDKEWALLHKTDWNTIEGDTYLTPDIVQRISDDDIAAYMKERGTVGEQATSAMMLQQTGHASTLTDRVRQDLALKLWAYFSERGQYAVLEPGAREKAILFQGTQMNSPLNLALRLLMQFKQFPTTMITKTWGTEIYGGGTRMDKIAGITELIVASTLAGAMSLYLNQLFKGQDPNSNWRNQPGQQLLASFIRGGAATIYGDFLLGEFSRHGFQALDALAGPTFGQTNRLFELYNDLKPDVFGKRKASSGSPGGALALKMARDNLPFMNMIYTRAAFDYLITYRLQEWLNPGYLRRMEQQMKDRSGTEFLLRPSQVSR